MVRYFPVMLCMLLIGTTVHAADPVHDTSAFIYYRIPLGGSTPVDKAHQFGLRLDQSWVDQDEAIDMNKLMSRNAVMDFSLSSNQPVRLKIHGVDYLQKYYASKADAGEAEAAEAPAADEASSETTATEPAAEQAEPAAESAEGEPGFTDELVDSLADVPFGIYLGLGLLGAIAAGG